MEKNDLYALDAEVARALGQVVFGPVLMADWNNMILNRERQGVLRHVVLRPEYSHFHHDPASEPGYDPESPTDIDEKAFWDKHGYSYHECEACPKYSTQPELSSQALVDRVGSLNITYSDMWRAYAGSAYAIGDTLGIALARLIVKLYPVA